MKHKRIFLIGPMGAGKTSVGKKLSRLLQYKFQDLDDFIEQQQQCSIHDIFTTFGESQFRKIEQQILNEVSLEQNIVVSTGGGSILSESTRNILPQRGYVCYLQVSPEQQVLRLCNDQVRPLLPSKQRLQFFKQMLERRGCLYTEIADMIVSTDNQSIDGIAKQIAYLITEYADNQ